ncbi:MAG TPA: hypothetical protein VHX38_16225 [Pseudonocardiaceae bacterium]|jgi:hypothetical protein|nr:hypothetical protein [Pseudonocardiaceae bacterium]
MSSEVEREVMAQTLTANVELVASVLRGPDREQGDTAMAAVAATRSLALIVEDTLHAVVQQARADGHTWAEIGRVLRVTRQAAFKRFEGTSAAEELFDDPDAPALEGAQKRALALLDDFLQRRLARLHEQFGDGMRERIPLELVESHRARMESRYGAFLEIGTPAVRVRLGHTFVDVPVAFERGDLRARAAFNVDGEVVGFRLQNLMAD